MEIVRFWNVLEVLNDFTFKTNKGRLELFAVLVSWMGTGFPIAFFILEGCVCGFQHAHSESIILFLKAPYACILHLRPKFFFTDKDIDHIRAIMTAYSLKPCLWLWNMRCAIKSTIAERRKDDKSTIGVVAEASVLTLVDSHCFRSTFLYSNSLEERFPIFISELTNFSKRSRRAQSAELFHGKLLLHAELDLLDSSR